MKNEYDPDRIYAYKGFIDEPTGVTGHKEAANVTLMLMGDLRRYGEIRFNERLVTEY